MQSDTAAQRRIGRYVLNDRLGRGAMGVVYRAQDPLINRTVAVKLLDILQTLSPEQTAVVHERFMREAQTAGNLDHPNIVKIYDVGHDDESGDFYIVMEYLPGPSLEQRLAAGPFEPEAALSLVQEIASALDAAHARGIVHRDIKPANILFTDDGLAKITDFGIARITTSHLTQDVRDLGTPVFMSPEQVTGRPLDGRADLFSLGTLAYQLLAGRPPFEGKNAVSLAYQIVHSTAPSPRVDVPALPAGIDAVMAKILAKDPLHRYPTGQAFAQALTEVFQPQRAEPAPHAQRPVGEATERSAPRKPRARIAWGLTACVAVAALLLARTARERPRPVAAAVAAPVATSPATTGLPPPAVPPTTSRKTQPPAPKASRTPAPGSVAGKNRGPSSEPRQAHVEPPTAMVETAVITAPPAVETAPEPVQPPAPVTPRPAHLSITLGHWISRGTLTVFADGHPILVREFSKKKIVPFQNSAWEAVEVKAGTRQLGAKVTTPKGETYVADAYPIELAAGANAAVRLGLRNEVLTFKRPGSEKDSEPASEKLEPEPSPGG